MCRTVAISVCLFALAGPAAAQDVRVELEQGAVLDLDRERPQLQCWVVATSPDGDPRNFAIQSVEEDAADAFASAASLAASDEFFGRDEAVVLMHAYAAVPPRLTLDQLGDLRQSVRRMVHQYEWTMQVRADHTLPVPERNNWITAYADYRERLRKRVGFYVAAAPAIERL